MDEDRAEDVLFGEMMRTHTCLSATQRGSRATKSIIMFGRVQTFGGDIKRRLGDREERREERVPGH